MTEPDIGRWALVGLQPAGRFLLERFRLRPDFPLVAVCVQPRDHPVAVRTYGLPLIQDYARILADPHIAGVVVTAQRGLCGEVVRAALSAGKRVLAEGSLGDSAAEACRLASLGTSAGQLSVFHLRRHDGDFIAARKILASGRLGRLHTIRKISCNDALPAWYDGQHAPDDWLDVLQRDGPFLFDQLQQLLDCNPQTATAWSCPPTRGFQARLEYEDGSSAWIDLQQSSVCGLETGWILEGTAGGYGNRRVMSRADDGELLQEELTADFDEEVDILTDLRAAALQPAVATAGLVRAIRTAAVLEAIQNAVQTGRAVPVRSLVARRDAAGCSPVEMPT